MKKINNTSDFRIISLSLISIVIFFTCLYFKNLPLSILKININDLPNIGITIYNIVIAIIATALTLTFILIFSKKNDDELKNRLKQIGIGLGAIAIYFFLPSLEAVPFTLCGVDPADLHIVIRIIYATIFEILLACIIMLIYNKKIKNDYKEMKKNSTEYFTKYIKYWFIALFIMMVSNLLINLLVTNSLPTNEQTIRDTFNISPFYIFFSAVIYAPIVEELIFRQSIKNIFNSKWLFIIISGLFFGSMHVFTDYNSLTDLLYIIPYSTPGILFAYMLEKSNNIFVPISFHFLHNGILISLQFLILLFG